MAHGAPDYSNVRKEEFIFRTDDMGELAVRMGSPIVYDRRGEVIFTETFKNGYAHWEKITYGTGGLAILDTDEFVSDGFSVKLVGGSDGGRQAKIYTQIPYLAVSKIGLEVRALINPSVEYFKIYIDQYTGDTLVYNRWRIDPINGVLAIMDESDSYVDVADITPIVSGNNAFHFLKLVCDFNDGVYVRGLFNNRLIDLSSYALPSSSDTSEPHLVITIISESVSGENGDTWVDNVIVTRNE